MRTLHRSVLACPYPQRSLSEPPQPVAVQLPRAAHEAPPRFRPEPPSSPRHGGVGCLLEGGAGGADEERQPPLCPPLSFQGEAGLCWGNLPPPRAVTSPPALVQISLIDSRPLGCRGGMWGWPFMAWPRGTWPGTLSSAGTSPRWVGSGAVGSLAGGGAELGLARPKSCKHSSALSWVEFSSCLGNN